MEKRSVQIFISYERLFSLVFSEEEWLVGATPYTWNFGSTGPRWSEIADFQPIFARSSTARLCLFLLCILSWLLWVRVVSIPVRSTARSDSFPKWSIKCRARCWALFAHPHFGRTGRQPRNSCYRCNRSM